MNESQKYCAKRPDTNYMMLDSICKKTVVTESRDQVIAWGQRLGRVLQKDNKKFLGLIVVVVISLYTIAKTHQTLHT